MTAGPAPSRAALDRRAWLLALGAALVVQLVVLYLPDVSSVPGTGVPGTDKVAHVAVFGAATLAGLRAGLPAGLVLGYGVGHAAASELIQHGLLAGRSGDVLDVVADVVGVALGWLLARLLARRADARPAPAPDARRRAS